MLRPFPQQPEHGATVNHVRASERPEVRHLTQTPLQLFQKFQRFIVASALEVMGESRIDRTRQNGCQLVDPFRDRLQTRHVRLFVATTFFVANHGEAFSQCLSEIGNRVFHTFNHE